MASLKVTLVICVILVVIALSFTTAFPAEDLEAEDSAQFVNGYGRGRYGGFGGHRGGYRGYRGGYGGYRGGYGVGYGGGYGGYRGGYGGGYGGYRGGYGGGFGYGRR